MRISAQRHDGPQPDRPAPRATGCFREAEKEYEATTGERIAHWQRRLLARYTRNLALAGNDLCAGVFDLTVAARGVADDNFAWDVWEAAGRYPPQKTGRDAAHRAHLRRRGVDATRAASACAAACPAPSGACGPSA